MTSYSATTHPAELRLLNTSGPKQAFSVAMRASTHLMVVTVCIHVAMAWFGTAYRASAFLFLDLDLDKAEIKPVDSFVFIGEIIKVQCKLLESTENVKTSDVSFKITHLPNYSPDLTSPIINRTPWIVPQENVTIVDNRTIYASIAVTEQFTASTTVACMDGNDKLISTFVYAERPLQNVTNFTAIYYCDIDSITLTWSLGQTYLDVVNNINVTVVWSPNSVPDLLPNQCEDQQQESCYVRTSGQDIIFFKVIVSITEVKNQGRDDPEFLTPLYDTNTTYISKFVLDDNRKTSPPINLKVVEVNKTYAVVTWDHGWYFRSCNCNTLYRLKITTNDNETIVEDVRHVGQQNVSVCNLIPFTNYRLSFEIKANEKNPWSEAASTEVFTLEDQPLDGPPMTDTSYHAKECVSNMKDIMVYWKDPQEKSLRGKLKKFEVVVGNESTQLRQASNFYLTRLQCDLEHEVLVYSATEVGLSITPSKMIIPTEELPKVNNFTVRLETNASSESQNAVVTWDPGSMRCKNISLIFYMCGETNFPNTCFDDYRTWEVSIDSDHLNLWSLPSSAVLFGYALRNERGQKRGIEWASCVYYANRRPEKLSNFIVKNQASALMISWNYRKCDQNTKILILCYHLFICPGVVKNVSGSCFQVTVDSSEQTYLAKGLEGGRSYSVFMNAESPAGTGYYLSDPIVGIPDLENNSSSSFIVGIIIGLVLLAILILVAVCIWHRCRSSKEKIKTYDDITQQLFQNLNGSKESGTDKKNSLHPSNLKSLHEQHPVPARLQAVASQPDSVIVTVEKSANETQPNHAAENTDSPTCVQPDTNNACSVSNGTIPYMRVINVGMNPLSHLHNNDISEENTIDEGYHSPEMRNNIPNFVQNTPQIPPQTEVSFMSQIQLPNQLVHVCNVTSASSSFQSDLPSHTESSTSFSDGRKGSEHAINHSLYRDQIMGQCIFSAESTRENSSSLENESNSSCNENLPGYVTCGFDEDINVAPRNILNCGTLNQQTVNIQTSLIGSMKEQQSSHIADQRERKDCKAGYKDIHFTENSPSAESITHGGNEVSAEINGTGDSSGVFLNGDLEVQKTGYLSQGIENDSQADDYVKQGITDVKRKVDYVSLGDSHFSQGADNVSQWADYVGQGNDNINQESDYVRQEADKTSERDGHVRQQADYVSQVDAHVCQGADYDRQEADCVSQGDDHVSQGEVYVSQGNIHVSQEEAYVSPGNGHVSQGTDYVTQEASSASQGTDGALEGSDYIKQALMDSCSNHSNETVSQSLGSSENNRLQYHQVGPSVHHLANKGDHQSTDFRTSLPESQNTSIPIAECTAYSDLSGEQQLQMLASVGPSVFLTLNDPSLSGDNHQIVGYIERNCIC